jgi:outer membrane biosynthesis protein TonB
VRALTKISTFIAWAVVAVTASADPQYQIYDIGVVQMGDTASQGFGVSTAGIAVGRSFQSSGTQAFSWTVGGGLVGLPNLSGRNYCRSDSANDSGMVVGTGSTTASGSGRLPVVWQNGVVSQLPLPSGQTLGDANGVNASGVAVGSVDGGSSQRGVIYSGGSAAIITQTTLNGSFFVTAFGVNNSGRVVGQGIDPTNAARNVGIVYDIGSANAFEVGALPGCNGALAFAVSNTGYVAGSSMPNQGAGLPFIWSDAGGIVAIPLAAGTTEGSARGVNSVGWVVGTDSSAFSIPFLYNGTTTYRLADLLPAGSGWDLSMNTSSSADGISDNGIIVGTGMHNGAIHAYAMVPVISTPTPSPTATPTPTTTPIATPTPTPSPAATPTPTPTPTATPTPTPTTTPTPTPAATPTPTPAPTPSPTPAAQALNLSTRMRVQTGDNVGIGGFIITGSTPKRVLIRGIGPSLVAFGITDALADPTLDLRAPDGSRILANDNWRDTQQTEIEATGIPPQNDLEAAIVATLPPGSYTAILRGKSQGTGVGLVEIYDLNQGVDSKLANLSTRAFVSTGDNIVIAGFTLGGNNGNDRIVVRGIGPSLTAFGVSNALADPTLELRDSNGALRAANNDWQDNPAQAAELTAAGLAPTNNLESGIAATLPPGAYTALLAGLNNGTGIGLVEVYDRGIP